MMKYPTQAELHKILHYRDGNLIWKVQRGSGKVGKIAGYHNGMGYREVRYKKRSYKAHRLIWIYVYGSIDPSLEIDHIDGVKDNNRVENLRLVTRRQNMYNCTGAKGYTWNKRDRKYCAQIRFGSKNIHLGNYDTKQEARQAYLDAKPKYHKIRTRND